MAAPTAPTAIAAAPLALLAVLVVLLGSCSGGDEQPAPPATAASTAPADSPAVPQEEGGPLSGLPPCSAPPAAAASADEVDGLLLPAGSVVTSVTENGPLVTVQGYVQQTPITIRRFYQERPGLELYEIEDEVFEAETLYGSGDFRTYLKASASCAEGSTLLAVVGPAGDLPAVGGGP